MPGRDARRIAIVVGPEGGMTAGEVERLTGLGAQAVTLGPRILRTETAGMAALSAILYRRGQKLDGAKWFGKLSTAVFYAVSLVLVIFIDLPQNVANILITLSAVMMIIAFAGYLRLLIRMYRGLGRKE